MKSVKSVKSVVEMAYFSAKSIFARLQLFCDESAFIISEKRRTGEVGPVGRLLKTLYKKFEKNSNRCDTRGKNRAHPNSPSADFFLTGQAGTKRNTAFYRAPRRNTEKIQKSRRRCRWEGQANRLGRRRHFTSYTALILF